MPYLRQLFCEEEDRRALVRGSHLNGIDYIEVSTETMDAQRLLQVYFLEPPPPAGLAGHPGRFRVEGGVRVRAIEVEQVVAVGQHLQVELDRAGDYSTYTLVIDSADLDRAYSRCDFSFKAGCPSRFDCKPRLVCPPEAGAEPPIDYLVKDYAGFRQALLDLLADRIPGWREQHEADLGVTLTELLSYAGDHLSYYQDAVASEAYLETARQRISVRRHARLIDYPMHDGASARVFIHFGVTGTATVPAGTAVLARIDVPLAGRAPPHTYRIPATVREEAVRASGAVFETLADAAVDPALEKIGLHAWGNRRCCLPRGATTADLVGDLTGTLSQGDFLLFEEIRGVETGLKADADPLHRQIVRLARPAERIEDPLSEDPATHAPPLALTRVSWADADALTFPLCLSARLTKGRRKNAYESRISIARGNLVLADHGYTVAGESHAGSALQTRAGRRRVHRVRLGSGPLSFRTPDPGPSTPVRALLASAPDKARAQVEVTVRAATGGGKAWSPVPHLLDSRSFDRHFAVETDNDGRAWLRFGDGELGRLPPAGSTIAATYRVGVGEQGNVGAEALAHVLDDGSLGLIEEVSNPLPAWGGVDPEPLQRVRELAPAALHARPVRAVTEEDWVDAAERHAEVTRAVATFRWTGSWHTVFLTVDRRDGKAVTAKFEADLRAFLERARLAGYDLEIDGPRPVALEIEIAVCVARNHFRGHVEEALMRALSSRSLPGGRRGFFHPDRFSFGEPLYLSRLYAAVEAVEGVDSAEARVFRRFGKPDADELEKGYVPIGRLEVVRLDNDANFPENGVLRLEMLGGR